jgi:hypothetical protein
MLKETMERANADVAAGWARRLAALRQSWKRRWARS